jgi:hypothetical protein
MQVETPLCKIAFKYGTDKCARIKHSYTPYYYKLFKKRRKTIKKVLEIGIGLKRRHSSSPKNTIGAGLYMWREFFPNAHIFGADVDTNTLFKDDRILTFLCDQSSKTDLLNLIKQTKKNIDIVIDDGSHIPEDQIGSCLTLMPLLKRDVIYIIEDVANPDIIDYLSDYSCEVVECGKRYDDRLVVVKNK